MWWVRSAFLVRTATPNGGSSTAALANDSPLDATMAIIPIPPYATVPLAGSVYWSTSSNTERLPTCPELEVSTDVAEVRAVDDI